MQISHYVRKKAQIYSADLTILTVALEHRTIGMHVQHCGRDNLSSLVISTKSTYNHTSRPRATTIATSHQYPPNIINSDILYYLIVCPFRNRLGARHDTTRDVRVCSIFSRSKVQPHHPPVDGRSSILAAESSLHTGCTEYTPAFDYSVICLRARTESPNMPAFEALTCTDRWSLTMRIE